MSSQREIKVRQTSDVQRQRHSKIQANLPPFGLKNFNNDLQDYISRTGVDGDGSCFVHSLLLATDPSYETLSARGRLSLVKQYRRDASRRLTQEMWENMAGGNLCNLAFQIKFRNLFDGIQSLKGHDLKKLDNPRSIPSLPTIFREMFIAKPQLFSTIIKTFPDNIETYLDTSNNKNDLKHKLVEGFCKKLKKVKESTKKTYVIDKYASLITEIIIMSMANAYQEIIDAIRDPRQWIESSLFSIFSELSDRDIYIFKSETALPYIGINATENRSGRNEKSVVMLWINECHYELLGQSTSKTNIIYDFDSNSEFIMKIKYYLQSNGAEDSSDAETASMDSSDSEDEQYV
ncbi:MAG: hypothetical protein JKX76_00840 [Colwellia sp.]|nr:hypothetical protein [Colwellia sp.]